MESYRAIMSSSYETSTRHGGQDPYTFDYTGSHNHFAIIGFSTINDTPTFPPVGYSNIGDYGYNFVAEESAAKHSRPIYVSFFW